MEYPSQEITSQKKLLLTQYNGKWFIGEIKWYIEENSGYIVEYCQLTANHSNRQTDLPLINGPLGTTVVGSEQEHPQSNRDETP